MQNVNSPDVRRFVEATEYRGPAAHAAHVPLCARLEGGLEVPCSLSVDRILADNREHVRYITHTHDNLVSDLDYLWHAYSLS